MKAVLDACAPGLVENFDASDALPCVAPRALWVLAGETDPRCWLEGTADAVARAATTYEHHGAGESLRVLVEAAVAHEHTEVMHNAALELMEDTLLSKGAARSRRASGRAPVAASAGC